MAGSNSILLCTLGASWAVIPEVVGFVAPELVDLFRDHPAREAIERSRREYGLRAPDEVWVLTTDSERTREGLGRLAEWWRSLGSPRPLRAWALAAADIADEQSCRAMRELTLRVCLRASDAVRARGGELVLSLAGGRKTMSADMQRAGGLFGCAALVHVVDSGDLSDRLRDPPPALLTGPLPARDERGLLAAGLMPVVVGRGQRAEFLDVEAEGEGPVRSERFPVPLPGPLGQDLSGLVRWPPEEPALCRAIERRERDSYRILGNFLDRIARDEPHENWRSLYRLPPSRIRWLRETAVGAEHRQWLRRFPKADLHCHLGGALGLEAQIEVGRAVWGALAARERRAAQELVGPLLGAARRGDLWPWDWPERLRATARAEERAAAVAALLVSLPRDALARQLFSSTEPRVALRRGRHGFAAYERPGELAGSAILGHEAAVSEYARQLLAAARAQGLRYLEVRGSPGKYLGGRHRRFLELFSGALAGAARPGGDGGLRIGFVWTLDRRRSPEDIGSEVVEAVRAHRANAGFVVGLDLAGDEQHGDLEALAREFAPAFEACLRVTVHAGERGDHDPRSIWAAVYHLRADRVGHGLTLGENAELAGRLRDRRVCLEVCPTSNREVVGFRDPALPEVTARCARYPLRALLALGLPVAICTDNPGISRTEATEEIIVASRMSDPPLSLWEALALMRQGFVHSFLPAGEREELAKEVDRAVFELLQSERAG